MIVLEVKKIEKSSISKFVFVCWQDEIKIWEMAIGAGLFGPGFLQRLYDSVIQPFIKELAGPGGQVRIQQVEDWLVCDEKKEVSAEELNVASKAT